MGENAASVPEKSEHVPNVAIEKGMNSLLEEGWFHGVLPREDVVRLLRQYVSFTKS